MFKPLEFEHVSIEDAAKSIEQTARPGNVKDWKGERQPAPSEPLADATAAWLASLPQSVRPRELPRQFPRVANRVCELWKRPAQCDVYLKKLIMDDRVGRKGFPPEVTTEVSALAGYYSSVYPYRHSIWDDVLRK